MRSSTIFFVDQQSFSNLAIYDYSLLSQIEGHNIYFWGSKLYSYLVPTNNVKLRKLFHYSLHRNKLVILSSYLWSMMRLIFYGLKYKPQIIHMVWIKLFQVDYLLLWFFQKVLGSKVVFTAHNILPHDYKPSDIKNYKKVYNISDAIICHTETSKKNLIELFPFSADKVCVISHGVLKTDINSEEIITEMGRIRKELNLSGKLVFSILGNQSKYKGTDIVLDAWSKSSILSKSKEAVLLIVGRCPNELIPNDMSSNMIFNRTVVSDLMFEAYLRLTSVLLMPYRAIDQSGLLLSAINSHIPFCVSNVGELTKPFEFGDVGWQFESIESNCVSRTIEVLLSHPYEIENKRNNTSAWELVNKYYDWNKSGLLTAALYNRLMTRL